MKEQKIKLNRGRVAVISAVSFPLISHERWYCSVKGYAVTNGTVQTGQQMKFMHRLILGAKKGQEVDHINGDKLDNRNHNLRIVTRSQQCQNAGLRRDSKTGYRGVCWVEHFQRYKAQINCNKKVYRLGSFKCPVEAAKAYDKAAKEIHGEYARLNFPDT